MDAKRNTNHTSQTSKTKLTTFDFIKFSTVTSPRKDRQHDYRKITFVDDLCRGNGNARKRNIKLVYFVNSPISIVAKRAAEWTTTISLDHGTQFAIKKWIHQSG